MADSKRQIIVGKIVSRMGTILVSNGYATDLGQTVDDWRINWQEDELPAVSVCDLTAEAELTTPTAARTVHSMPVQIRIYSQKAATPANLRTYLKDVYKAIRVDDRWDGEAMHTRPVRDGFLIPDDNFEVVGAVVEIEVQFITEKFNAEGLGA